ncbi:hypothetical protein WJX77_008586 [Trebouxia sp. C0004]
MVYVGSADTTAISAQLPNHPHILLLLQRALGSYLAGPHTTLPSLVLTCHTLWTERGDSPAEVWYAELLLIFSFQTKGPIEPEADLRRTRNLWSAGQGPTACILPVLLQSRVKTWINGLLPAADDIKASLLSTPSASPYSEKS